MRRTRARRTETPLPPSDAIWWADAQGRLNLRQHPGQARAWDSDARFVFVIAGSQGGKTSFGPWWLAREMQRRGPGDYLAVSATADLARMKMVPVLRECFERVLRWCEGAWRASDRYWEVVRDPLTGAPLNGKPWGRVILRSAAAGGGLESATANAAWLDECGQDEFTVETWEAVLRRLSLASAKGGGRVLGTTTPYNLGWLKSAVYDRWARIGAPDEHPGDRDFDVVQFDSTANPSFPRAEFERARASMPDWRFRMMYRGELARPAGLIYDCFDDMPPLRRHTYDPATVEIGHTWTRWVGVDFGAVNTALVWLAEHPATGTYYLYRESLSGDRTTAEHAAEAAQHARNERVMGAYGGAGSENQQRWDWQAAGFPVYAPQVADVESGIDRVTALIKADRLLVSRDCTGVLDELAKYKRKLDPAGHPTEEIADKRTFHHLDALRYVCAGVTGGHGPLSAEQILVGGPRRW